MAAGKQLSVRGRFWRRHLERWRQSGLSQAQYCRRHHLSAPAFGWWKGRLSVARRSDEPGATKGPFVELTLGGGEAVVVSDEIVYEIVVSRQRRLRLGPGFEPERVRQLLEVLEGAC
jgi:hypothetical protein